MVIDVSSWGWPQWTVVVVYALTLLIAAATHGKPRTGNTNFMVTLVVVTMWCAVLGFGGLWG